MLHYFTLSVCKCTFYRSVDNKRMSDFFKNDFNEDRWRKAALKNAFDLLGRQRFEHAAAFFLLAGHLKDAIEVRMLFNSLNKAGIWHKLIDDLCQCSASLYFFVT